MIKKLSLSIILAASCVALLPCGLFAAHAPDKTKRILVIPSYNIDYKGSQWFLEGVMAEFNEQKPFKVSFLHENLQLAAHATDRIYMDSMAASLKIKYALQKPDLIIIQYRQALQFMERYGKDIFGDIPVVFAGLSVEGYVPDRLPKHYTGIVASFSAIKNIELILQNHLATRKIYVVGGFSPVEQNMVTDAIKEGAPYLGKVKFFALTDMTYPALLEKLGKLEIDSVVMYQALQLDAAGNVFVPAQAAIEIAKASRVPVYGMLDTYMGSGITGGFLIHHEGLGRKAAKIAIDWLQSGVEPEARVKSEPIGSYRFDWRELKRWRIGEDGLPPESKVEYKTFSTWESYKNEIIGTVFLILLQVIFIIGLLRSRHRLIKAEKEIKQNELQLRSLLDILQHPSETIQDFLDYALEQAIQLTKSKIGYIYHYHEDRKEFVLNTWSKEVMASCAVANPQNCYELDKTGIWGEAVRQRCPIIVNDFQAAHPLKKGYPEGHVEISKFLTVPIFRGANVVGVVGVANKETDYEETDIIQISLLMESVWKVTERKQAEEALRESEGRYRLVVENNNDIIWTFDLSSMTYTYVSPSAKRILGYGDETTVKNLDVIFTPETKRHVLKLFGEFMGGNAKGNILAMDAEHRKQDGSLIWMEISASPLKDDLGKIVGFLGGTRDITDRKQAEEQIKQASRFPSENPNPVMRISAEGILEYANDSSKELLSLMGFEIGRQINTEWHARISEALANGHPNNIEFQAGDRTFSATLGPIVDRGYVNLYATDITERKHAEAERIKLEGQLYQAQKIESVGRLAGGVAHDFNNMLGLILGHAEMALDNVDPTLPIHADLREIIKAAERSADLTRQLLAFARQQTVQPKVLDLNETVANMLKMLQRLIGEDIDLKWQSAADLWSIKMDPTQIDQIMANLCINARDAISDTGKISIETGNTSLDEAYCADHTGFVPGEYVKLIVSDDGGGMNKDTVDHIFEPFFTTKGVGKGTGLGLSTVYGIVRQNSGFINVYSEPGHGTTFTIYLPRYIGRDEKEQAKAQEQRPLMRGQETLLLVEDEPALLELNKMILEKQGYRVLAAGTPNEAIRLAGEHTGEIHLLVTDVVMPEMNGRDLAKRLSALKPHLKCLFTSGYTANVIAHHGVLDEGVYFIQKPFSRQDLTAKVRQVLEQK